MLIKLKIRHVIALRLNRGGIKVYLFNKNVFSNFGIKLHKIISIAMDAVFHSIAPL